MAFCSNCGEHLGSGNFCTKCGSPVDQSYAPPVEAPSAPGYGQVQQPPAGYGAGVPPGGYAGVPIKKKFPVWGIILIVCASLLVPILIFVAIAVPVIISSRSNAQKRTCQANLRTIEGALQTYYAENEKYPTSVDELVPDFLKKNPTCPTSGKTYVLELSSKPGEPPTISCPTNEPGHTIW
jgi:competence protein ComGC